MGGASKDKRINIGLPRGVLEKLERYANSRGSKVASDATYLLTRLLDDMDAEGKIPEASPEELSAEESLDILVGFLNSLVDEGNHNGYSLAEVAEILGREDDKALTEMVKKLNGNGKSTRRVKAK